MSETMDDGTADRTRRAPRIDLRVAYGYAVLTGVLWALAFCVPRLWFVALVALAPLAIALEGRTSRQCFGLGIAAGFTQYVAGLDWLYSSLRTFTAFSAPVCAALMIATCLYQGARLGVFAWIYGRARERGWPRGRVFLLAFGATEWGYPLLFPSPFGACAHSAPALLQLAEWGGPCAVGLLLAAPSLALAEAALGRPSGGGARWWAVLAGAAIVPLGALGGALRIRAIDARASASPAVRVGIVQANVSPANSPRGSIDGLRANLGMSAELRDRGVDLLVWSEGVVNSVGEDVYKRELPKLFTRQLRLPLVFGAILTHGPEEPRAMNVVLTSRADGRVDGRYDKRLLFPFGEYLPFGETFPALYRWMPHTEHFHPGNKAETMAIAGHRLTALICYEDLFPGFVNDAIRRSDAEMIVNVSNDAWFGDTIEPFEHFVQAQFRAVEHRRYLVRAANSGVSAVVDPAGRVVFQSQTFRPEIADVLARWMPPTRTGYEIWGDAPWWIAAALAIGMAMVNVTRVGWPSRPRGARAKESRTRGRCS
jgi:apolipoprotein N-acyltransferase